MVTFHEASRTSSYLNTDGSSMADNKVSVKCNISKTMEKNVYCYQQITISIKQDRRHSYSGTDISKSFSESWKAEMIPSHRLYITFVAVVSELSASFSNLHPAFIFNKIKKHLSLDSAEQRTLTLITSICSNSLKASSKRSHPFQEILISEDDTAIWIKDVLFSKSSCNNAISLKTAWKECLKFWNVLISYIPDGHNDTRWQG